jgi:hypothetical protein
MKASLNRLTRALLCGLLLFQGAILPGHVAVHAVQALGVHGPATATRAPASVLEGRCELCQTFESVSSAVAAPSVGSLHAPTVEAASNSTGPALVALFMGEIRARGPPAFSFS